jgi:hypothetical protein
MTLYVNGLDRAPLGRLVSLQNVELSLLPRQVLTLGGDKRGLEIQCLRGTLWITQANDRDDYFLQTGDTFSVSKAGTVVIQGMKQAQLRIRPHA